jgi:hypothetical protein
LSIVNFALPIFFLERVWELTQEPPKGAKGTKREFPILRSFMLFRGYFLLFSWFA